MIVTSIAVLIRIFSNSMSNVYQKQLTANDVSPFFINFVMYFGLCICCIPLVLNLNPDIFTFKLLLNALLGGLCGALGNTFLVKALERGELSVLGPINAYKSVVAMLAGIFLLKELPSTIGILAIALVIAGSYFIFDTQKEGFSLKLLKRKDIQYRIYALIFTAIEAVFIKNVIVQSDIMTSFFFWCLFGMIFTFLFVTVRGEFKICINKFILSRLLLVTVLMGFMQYSTNFVFERMNVSYALALFQLSAILSVLFGWKYFKETQVRKKLFGSLIMVIGSVILILWK